MKYLVMMVLAAAAIGLAPAAQAQTDEVLCSSNMAYRNSEVHKDECKDVGINSHGSGGAYDADGDGVPADVDMDDHDRNVGKKPGGS